MAIAASGSANGRGACPTPMYGGSESAARLAVAPAPARATSTAAAATLPLMPQSVCLGRSSVNEQAVLPATFSGVRLDRAYSLGPERWRLEARCISAAPGRETFVFPPGGFLEGFELMLPEPLGPLLGMSRVELRTELWLDGQAIGGLRAFSLNRGVRVDA